MNSNMNSNKFRAELVKIMPGYKWTVHRPSVYDLGEDKKPTYLKATGVQTAGFNRLSTLQVVKREKGGNVEYEAKSSGFGSTSPWLSEYTDGTLARALRGLQTHYEHMAQKYGGHAASLESGRKK